MSTVFLVRVVSEQARDCVRLGVNVGFAIRLDKDKNNS